MSFITRHQRMIAVIAAFSFFYLIGIGSLLLRASTVTNSDQQPGAIEKANPSGAHSVKKSPIIPIIIGVVVVGAVAAVLILVVFKTKYDITGTWSGPFINEDDFEWTATCTFTGDKKSGTVVYTEFWGTSYGSYTVDGKAVSFTCTIEGDSVTFTGQFITKDQMSGTWLNNDVVYSGTWQLNRGATVLASIPSQTSTTSPFKKK